MRQRITIYAKAKHLCADATPGHYKCLVVRIRDKNKLGISYIYDLIDGAPLVALTPINTQTPQPVSGFPSLSSFPTVARLIKQHDALTLTRWKYIHAQLWHVHQRSLPRLQSMGMMMAKLPLSSGVEISLHRGRIDIQKRKQRSPLLLGGQKWLNSLPC